MMEQVIEELQFLKELENRPPPSPFQEKVWARLLETGLPTEKHELFKYLPLKKILSRQFRDTSVATVTNEQVDSYILQECRQSALVFINGEYQESLSRLKNLPKGVLILPQMQAMKGFATLIQGGQEKWLQEERDPFALLAKSQTKESVFVYVPPRVVMEIPLQIVNILTMGSRLITPSLQLHFGQGSEAKIVETTHSIDLDQSAFVSGITQFFLSDRANVNLFRIFGPLPEKSCYFNAIRAHLKQESFFRTVSSNVGAEVIRDDYQVYLNGEGGEACLNGIWNLKGSLQSHTHVRIDHIAENCRSNQLFKGVVADTARSSFEGKIFVEKSAQKTNAFQLNNNLLLSPRAESFSKPNLEIFADDVKASHGATVGPVDQEELFYLKTRGIPLEKANELLIKGYCQEVLNLFPDWLKSYVS